MTKLAIFRSTTVTHPDIYVSNRMESGVYSGLNIGGRSFTARCNNLLICTAHHFRCIVDRPFRSTVRGRLSLDALVDTIVSPARQQ